MDVVGHVAVSRASTKHASGAEQKCTTREVIGQRKCPGQLFGRSVTEAGWQAGRRLVSEVGSGATYGLSNSSGACAAAVSLLRLRR